MSETPWCYRRHHRHRRPWQRAIQVSRIYRWWTPMTFRMAMDYYHRSPPPPPPSPTQTKLQPQIPPTHSSCTMHWPTFVKIISNTLNAMTRKWGSDFCAHSAALSITQPSHGDMSPKFPPSCMNTISMKQHRPTAIAAMWKRCKHASIIVWKFANISHRIAAICCSGKPCTWSKCEESYFNANRLFFAVFRLECAMVRQCDRKVSLSRFISKDDGLNNLLCHLLCLWCQTVVVSFGGKQESNFHIEIVLEFEFKFEGIATGQEKVIYIWDSPREALGTDVRSLTAFFFFASTMQCAIYVHSFHVTFDCFQSLTTAMQVGMRFPFSPLFIYSIENFSSFYTEAILFIHTFMFDSFNGVDVYLFLVVLHCDKKDILYIVVSIWFSFRSQRNRGVLSFVSKFMQLLRTNIDNQREVSTWIVISAWWTSGHWTI